MILDRQNLFSWKQAVTVTADSTDIIDLGPPMWNGNAGSDRPIDVIAVVESAFTAAGAATLLIELKSSPVSDFSSGVITHQTVGPIAKTALGVPGRLSASLHIPPDVQRYVKLTYTVATGPMTAGTITAGVATSRQTNF